MKGSAARTGDIATGEKVATLGVQREPNYLYFVKDGAVWKVPEKKRGVPKGEPEQVTDGEFEMDPHYVYFVDETGDVARIPAADVARQTTPRQRKAASKIGGTRPDGHRAGVTLALTVRQPWASLIAAGIKTVENRSWIRDDILGQRIAIHSSGNPNPQARTYLAENLPTSEARARKIAAADNPLSTIVCTAVVAEFVTSSESWWFSGPFGWVLTDIRPCEPIRCSGALRLWSLPAEIASRLR